MKPPWISHDFPLGFPWILQAVPLGSTGAAHRGFLPGSPGAAPGSETSGMENHGRVEASWKIQWLGGSELRSYGYSYSLWNGAVRSYQEFPHILVIWLVLWNIWITTFHLLGINPPTSHRIWNQYYINSMSLKQQQWGYFNDENGELDKHEWWFTSKLRIQGKSCKNNTCNTNRIWFWMILVDVISKNWIFVVMNTSMIPRCLDRCRLRRWKA